MSSGQLAGYQTGGKNDYTRQQMQEPGGYDQKDEALKQMVKRRNPVWVFLFGMFTLGIYTFIWLVSTSKELRNFSASAPNPNLLWLILIPFANAIVMIIYFWEYSKALSDATHFNSGTLFLLFVLLTPAGMLVAQKELNQLV